jgi:predicted esterase
MAEAASTYLFDPARVIAVGYSNGANIAASLLLLHPTVLAGAVLFHSMVPIVPDELPNLTGVPVFMGSGRLDTMIPPAQAEALERMLTEAGATVTAHWEQAGHALNRQEIEAAAEWLGKLEAGGSVPGGSAT